MILTSTKLALDTADINKYQSLGTADDITITKESLCTVDDIDKYQSITGYCRWY